MVIIQGQPVEVVDGVAHVHIKKPIYGTTVSLNSHIIKYCINNYLMLRVSCNEGGRIVSGEYSPQEWVSRSKFFQKEMRIKGHPMSFYQASVGEAHSRKDESVTQLQLI